MATLPEGSRTQAIEALHTRVDAQVAPLHTRHAERLQCRKGCHSCCVDELTVFEVEAELIQSHHADLLSHAQPHPPGACAFLDQDGACRIYAHRPYVCRTQGLPLRWVEEVEDGYVEYRDICPLNEAGEPVEAIEPEACWTLGDAEGELAQMQAQRDGGALNRVALRDLFLKDGHPK